MDNLFLASDPVGQVHPSLEAGGIPHEEVWHQRQHAGPPGVGVSVLVQRFLTTVFHNFVIDEDVAFRT